MRQLLTFSAIFLQLTMFNPVGSSSRTSSHTGKLRGFAKITNTQAVRNSVNVQVDGKVYTLSYGESLTVYTNEESTAGSFRKIIYLDSHGQGVFNRKRFVFEGMRYILAFNQNGDYELYQGL